MVLRPNYILLKDNFLRYQPQIWNTTCLDSWLWFSSRFRVQHVYKIYILYKILFINHFHKLKPLTFLFFYWRTRVKVNVCKYVSLSLSWLLFDEERYSGNQYILWEGHYPDLTSCGCTSTAIKSLKPIPYVSLRRHQNKHPSCDISTQGFINGLVLD